VAAPCGILAVCALVAVQLGVNEAAGLGLAFLILLPIYCALVYWLGYARFKRLEAVDAPSRELSLPAGLEAFFVRPLTKVSARFHGPFATLLKKEFRLQQICFLLAGLFVLIAVAGFCLINRHPKVAGGIIGGDYMVYMLILPLIAGAISVAEEKGWGMAEWHLTLPPSALKQWSAKMLLALSTSLILGLLLPAALFLAGQALLGQLGSRTPFRPLRRSLRSALRFVAGCSPNYWRPAWRLMRPPFPRVPCGVFSPPLSSSSPAALPFGRRQLVASSHPPPGSMDRPCPRGGSADIVCSMRCVGPHTVPDPMVCLVQFPTLWTVSSPLISPVRRNPPFRLAGCAGLLLRDLSPKRQLRTQNPSRIRSARKSTHSMETGSVSSSERAKSSSNSSRFTRAANAGSEVATLCSWQTRRLRWFRLADPRQAQSSISSALTWVMPG